MTEDTRPSEFAWLIERGQPEKQVPTVWWAPTYMDDWTEDANKAFRFDSRERAEEIIAAKFTPPPSRGGPSARAVEHGFLGDTRPSDHEHEFDRRTCVVCGFIRPSRHEDTRPSEDRPRDLPSRVVVGTNGAYWRDYGDHYSMCPVSEDNDPVEIVAIYNRQEADATAWDRGFKAGLDAASRPAPDTRTEAPTIEREKALIAAEYVDGGWTDEGDHIEYGEDLPERLIDLRRDYWAFIEAERAALSETPSASPSTGDQEAMR